MPSFHIDASRFQSASRKLALMATKKSPREVLRAHLKQFLKTAIGLTPPSQGTANIESRQRGETAIADDFKNVIEVWPQAWIDKAKATNGKEFGRNFLPNKRGQIYLQDNYIIADSVEEVLRFHESKRLATGRVSQAGTNDQNIGRSKANHLMIVSSTMKTQVLAVVQGRVGLLASGWNRSAASLGVRVPQWIARHGDKNGAVIVTETGSSITIALINNVPYANRVKGFERRVQSAFDQTASNLEKGYANAIARAAKSAGF
jgi:hypothetical protein